MRRLIVDGYNLLHHVPEYVRLADEDIDLARARLVEDVGSFATGRYRATVVFDGGGNPASTGEPHHVAGVAVLFSKAGQDADAAIERLARRARERGEQAVVATSDAQTQFAVAAEGVTRMSSAELAREMRDAEAERPRGTVTGQRRTMLEDRVDPEVRERLFRWARGR